MLNPIELGSTISAKDCVLDVKLVMNSRDIINIELQMVKQEYWVKRSLLYFQSTRNFMDDIN